MKRMRQIFVGVLALAVLGACAGQSAGSPAAPTIGPIAVSAAAPASISGSSAVGSSVVVPSSSSVVGSSVVVPSSSSVVGSSVAVSPAPAGSVSGSSLPGPSSSPIETSASRSTAPGQTSAPRPSAPISPAPTTSSRGSTGVPPATGPTGKRLTLHGTVQEGVEGGCLLLRDTTTGQQYNLTGGNAAVVKVGANLTVVGVTRKDLMSYCQQGQIFQVLEATAK